MRQEGRGIGLANKLKAYGLQDGGKDTVEANIALGFKPDLRDYGVGAQILVDLGVGEIRLPTNNPRKIVGLEGYGLPRRRPRADRDPPHETNVRYLRTKKAKLGHPPGPRMTAIRGRRGRKGLAWRSSEPLPRNGHAAAPGRGARRRPGEGGDSGSVTVVEVPGAFEIPAAAGALARAKRHDAIVCLGAVVRGETPISTMSAPRRRAGSRRSPWRERWAWGFGLLTTETLDQAAERAGGRVGNKGWGGGRGRVPEMASLLENSDEPAAAGPRGRHADSLSGRLRPGRRTLRRSGNDSGEDHPADAETRVRGRPRRGSHSPP